MAGGGPSSSSQKAGDERGPDPLPLTQGECQGLVLRGENPGGAASWILTQHYEGAEVAGHWGAWLHEDLSHGCLTDGLSLAGENNIFCRGRLCRRPPMEVDRGAELLAVPPVLMSLFCAAALQGDGDLPALRSMHQLREDDYW